jgi:hypothetical protein
MSVGFYGDENSVDLEALRARLRKVSDMELRAFGKDARYMCSPAANLGKPPREPFLIQLAEARAEWKRRERDWNGHKNKPRALGRTRGHYDSGYVGPIFIPRTLKGS